ncbi:MAG: HAD-IA family hydrolase [bacterium]
MKKQPKTIIFDFDGVLVDTYQIVYGINKQSDPQISEEEFRAMFDVNFYNSKRPREPKFSIDFYKEFLKYEENIVIHEQNRLTLKNLSKENTLSINSSNINDIVGRVLNNNKALNFFSKLYGVDIHKSKVEKFKMIFSDFKTTPDKCLFVSDTVGDILEAREVGIKSLAYVGFESFHPKDYIKQAKPYGYIENLSEIEGFI